MVFEWRVIVDSWCLLMPVECVLGSRVRGVVLVISQANGILKPKGRSDEEEEGGTPPEATEVSQ